MDNLFHVSTAPHIRDSITTKNIMYDVILALIPATIFGIYQFGIDAFLVVSVAIITSLLSEYLYQRFMKLPITVYDGSAILTVTTEDGGHTDMLTVVVNDGTSVEDIKNNTGLDLNAPIYDVVGRQVDATYKGVIIQNGNKYLLR